MTKVHAKKTKEKVFVRVLINKNRAKNEKKKVTCAVTMTVKTKTKNPFFFTVAQQNDKQCPWVISITFLIVFYFLLVSDSDQWVSTN